MDETENKFNTEQPTPAPEEDAYGRIKGAKTDKGADVYAGLTNATMSFDGIKYLEALNGNIVLRGRNGQRDVIFTLEKATAKYLSWMDMVYQYAKLGVKGWDTMMDIGKDFKARICEAVYQRKKMGLKVPADAEKLAQVSQG